MTSTGPARKRACSASRRSSRPCVNQERSEGNGPARAQANIREWTPEQPLDESVQAGRSENDYTEGPGD
jgi:hypothetical protein